MGDFAEVDAITSYTLSTFRVVNFLREYYQENGLISLVNNEYFEIKNWNDEVTTFWKKLLVIIQVSAIM